MDGLEDQAEAEAQRLIDRLSSHERLEIGHSSRDSLMQRITDAMMEAAQQQDNITTTQAKKIVTKILVLRSGISVRGLNMLRGALEGQARDNKDDSDSNLIRELEFVKLRNLQEVAGAIACCHIRGVRIERLCLQTYHLPRLENRQALVNTITGGIFGDGFVEDEGGPNTVPGFLGSFVSGPIHTLTTLEIVGYPIGSEGVQILAQAVALNDTLRVLKLMDCDLLSDSTKYLAQMIRCNCRLEELDLSYNRSYLGTALTRDFTVKTLVQQGLKYNMTLLQLEMRETRGNPINRSAIDKQLAMNRLGMNFVKNNGRSTSLPSSMWPLLMSKVSTKPAILHLVVCDAAQAVLAN